MRIMRQKVKGQGDKGLDNAGREEVQHLTHAGFMGLGSWRRK